MTGPVQYLAEPALKFPKVAFRAKRLINIPTGKTTLAPEQVTWLTEAARAIPNTANFTVYMFGYASKLGYSHESAAQSDASNYTLSYGRANEATKIMESVNPRVTPRVDRFLPQGSHGYTAAADDDSGYWRAVEVHIFLGNPPPPPPNPGPPPPCGGLKRYREWSVATPVGFTFSPAPGATVGGNIVLFRRGIDRMTHTYLQLGAGGGFSYSGPSLKGLLAFVQAILSGLSWSGISWTPLTAVTPFTFADLNGAACMIASAGVGVIGGYQQAYVSVHGQVWFRDASGSCMFANKDFFTNVNVSGKDLQFGVGGSAIGGPLMLVS